MAGLTDVILSDVFPLVAKVSPLLGTVLGSPFAGLAISLICKAFNVDVSKPDQLAATIANDPQASDKLKALEIEHSDILAKMASTDYQTEVADRESARGNALMFKDFLRHMAYLVTFGFFLALFALFLPIPFENNERELLSMLVGMLVSKWQTIIDFFFGSSQQQKQGGFK